MAQDKTEVTMTNQHHCPAIIKEVNLTQQDHDLKEKQAISMNKYYRPQSVAEILNIALSTFWLYVKQNKISTIKLSARVTVVSDSELQRFINAGVCND